MTKCQSLRSHILNHYTCGGDTHETIALLPNGWRDTAVEVRVLTNWQKISSPIRDRLEAVKRAQHAGIVRNPIEMLKQKFRLFLLQNVYFWKQDSLRWNREIKLRSSLSPMSSQHWMEKSTQSSSICEIKHMCKVVDALEIEQKILRYSKTHFAS